MREMRDQHFIEGFVIGFLYVINYVPLSISFLFLSRSNIIIAQIINKGIKMTIAMSNSAFLLPAFDSGDWPSGLGASDGLSDFLKIKSELIINLIQN